MMAHIESSSYIKNNDGSEIMKFVMNNPEGERADLSKVEIEITLSTITTMGTRQDIRLLYFHNLMVRLTVMKGSPLKEKMRVHYI